MAACKISELVPELVNQFIKKSDHLENADTLKNRLTKSVYKRLYKPSNSWLIDINIIKENYSVDESMKTIIADMKEKENYMAAEALTDCLKQLSDDKGHIHEQLQMSLRFLVALFNMHSSEIIRSGILCSENYETNLSSPKTEWYSGSSSQPGVLRMFSNDIFELEDVFSPSKLEKYLPSESGLKVWTRGMKRDLQILSPYFKQLNLNNFNLLRQNSIDETSQIVSEYSSWNTPSDDDDCFNHNVYPSASIFDQNANSEITSQFLSFDDVEIIDENLSDKLMYEDSMYHLDSNKDLFLEQQFTEPPLLLRAHDIANLLCGLSSDSFYILKSGKFVNIFCGGDNAESNVNYALLSDYINAGTLFVCLYNFARQNSAKDQGSVMDALKFGISRYLLHYELTVSSTLLNDLEHISLLNYQFDEFKENLRYVAHLCGFQDHSSNCEDIPIGIDLIDYLYDMATSAGSGPTHTALLFLIKHTYSPYLRFLQRWLFEGICDDLLEEFHLHKNLFYEKAKDELYWTSCYTILNGDVKQSVPIFLKSLAEDILICGKSFNLLKRCCPNHILFSVDLPTPNLELGLAESTTRNIQKKACYTMIARLSCILENLDKRTFIDENFNDTAASYSKFKQNLRSCLIEVKYQIQLKLESIFPEEKLVSLQNLLAIEESTKHTKYVDDLISENSKEIRQKPSFLSQKSLKRRNSLPETYCVSLSVEYLSECGILFSTVPKKENATPSSIAENIFVSNNEKSVTEKETSLTNQESTLTNKEAMTESNNLENKVAFDGDITSFRSFIYEEANNYPMCHREVISSEEELSEEKAIDRLIKKLTADLSDGDDIDNLQLFYRKHFSSLIQLSLHPVIKAQINIVNRCVLGYFFDVLEIQRHFNILLNFYALHDGEFGESLCRQLFNLFETIQTSPNALNSAKLNSILLEALSNSVNEDSVNTTYLSLHIKSSYTIPRKMFHLLKLIRLEYEIQWPCNIIITESQILSYNRILTFLLEIQHVLSTLKHMWLHFKKLNGINSQLNSSPHFCTLQLYRHEMQHFVKSLKCYIGSEILDLAWHDFQMVLSENVNNLEDLRNAHSSYINTILEACMLNPDSCNLLSILHEVLKNIQQFHTLLIYNTWHCKNGIWEHKEFLNLEKEFKSYQKNMLSFYKAVVALCHQKYQMYLERLLLIVDFNRYYKKIVL